MSVTIHNSAVVGPCVHLNGTSRESLLSALEAAHVSLGAAYDTIRECAPNGRDYYIGNVHLSDATRQHMERLAAVDAVRKSIEDEIEIIYSQDVR